MALEIEDDKTAGRASFANFLKTARFYPAEYALTLITSLIILVAGSLLGAMLIDYWLHGTAGVLADLSMLYVLATLIVVTPIHLVFYWRVRHTDRSSLTVLSLRISNLLLAAYLFATVGTIIMLSVWLVVAWLNAWMGTGEMDKQLLSASLSLVQAIAWFKYASWHFLRTRTDTSRPKYYGLTLTLLVAALIIVSLALPVRAYRDVARDFVKEADLSQVEQAIHEYVDVHGALPTDLSQLELDSGQEKRLSDYRYTARGGTNLGILGYELCATFAKSAGEGRDEGYGYTSHRAGEQCFSRVTISGSKLEQGLATYFHGVANGAAKLEATVQQYLANVGVALRQEITGVEVNVDSQIRQLERYLEGVEGGSQSLEAEMQRLEQDIQGSANVSGALVQDFNAIEQFIRGLLGGLGQSQ